MGKSRLIALAVVASLVLAACGSSTPTSAPGATDVAVTSTPAPTAVPTPTAPPDVAALFAAQADSLDSGSLTYSGTVTVGLVRTELTGSGTWDGPDERAHVVATVGGVDTIVDAVRVAGTSYAKVGSGPWLAAPATSTASLAGELQKLAKGKLTNDGTEVRSGQTLHRLIAGSTDALDPTALLSSAAGAQALKAEVVYLATEGGVPVIVAMDASWSQAAGEGTVDVTVELDVRLNGLGASQTIRAPEGVWVRFTSSRYHASFAHPDKYEYEKAKKYDALWGADDDGITLERVSASGGTLSAWGKAVLSTLKREFRAKTGTNTEATLGGAKARLLYVSGKYSDGTKATVFVVVAIKGKYVYFLSWFSPAGNVDADRETFEQVMGTFTFTP